MPRYLFEILENDHADDGENRLLRVEEGGRLQLGIITGTPANSTETILSLAEVALLADELQHWLHRYRKHAAVDLWPYVNLSCKACGAAISARMPDPPVREFACWNCGEKIRITITFGSADDATITFRSAGDVTVAVGSTGVTIAMNARGGGAGGNPPAPCWCGDPTPHGHGGGGGGGSGGA